MPNEKLQTIKRKRIKIPIEVKKQIIEQREQGVSVIELARQYNRTTSTICGILKMKEKLKPLNVSRGVSRRSEKRSQIIDDVESLLLRWINEKQTRGENVTQNSICEQAKRIFNDIVRNMPAASTSIHDVFKASNGWFERFKKRAEIQNVARRGEPIDLCQSAENDFDATCKELVRTEIYLPQQIFNCVEIGLFWRELPNAAQLTGEAERPLGDDRLKLLLCGNASGDLKIKPLLVYAAEHARAFETGKVQHDQSNVLWRSSARAWITRDIFIDWIRYAFCPSVKRYLMENNLALHASLVLDNALGHLADELPDEFGFISIQLLSADATPLLQPMDRQVIHSFKKRYLMELFKQCAEATAVTVPLSLEEFWTHHFHLDKCVTSIEKAWAAVAGEMLSSAWKRLYPNTAYFPPTQNSPATSEPTIGKLVTLANSLGLENANDEIVKLLTDDVDGPSNERAVEQNGLVADEKAAPQASEDILSVLQAWDIVSAYVRKHHPNETIARQANDVYETNAISYFRSKLKLQQHSSPVCRDPLD